jgi:Leucine-rich repeat (LRR) protein
MEWMGGMSEWFDKVGRDFNRAMKGEAGEKEKAERTGMVSFRDGNYSTLPEYVLQTGAKLRVMDVTRNRIQSLPDKFDTFKVLTKVHLGQNQLTSLPASLCLATITILNLEHNRLTKLPEALGKLVKLKKLELHNNPLAELPSSIGELQCLELLDISKCNLTCTAERDTGGLAPLGRCKLLGELRLSNNRIERIPDSLGQLTRLKVCLLDCNPLKSIPGAFLKGCINLQKFSLLSTGLTLEDLENVDGYKEFEARRQDKHTKQIHANVLLDNNRFDDGLDHKMMHPK